MDSRPEVIDAHIHYALPADPAELIRIMDSTGTDEANLVIVPHRQRLSSVPDALMAKAMYPGRFYVFSSLDVSVLFRFRNKVGKRMAEYSRRMLDCGCDGIKIIEGKPAMRKMLPVPDWDSKVWDPFFDWCEKERIPILWHVNDPETFWDAEKAPSWAAEQGWLYDDSFINNEDQYSQVLNLLERHPRLKIIFAHFFFMSAQLDRLSSIMDRYPGIMIDITPGIEMYENFSLDIDKARAFFSRYSDRIVYGTDIGAKSILSGKASISPEESACRAAIVRRFLSGGGSWDVPGDGVFLSSKGGFTMKCLDLDGDTLANILGANFRRFVGKPPAPVNGRAVLKECRRIRTSLKIMSLFDRELEADTSCIEQVDQYFRKRRQRG